MKCAKCGRVTVIAWTARTEVWRLLARRWWDKVLCLECFVELVSRRQKNLVILQLDSFLDIVFASRRCRGALTKRWPFPTGLRVGCHEQNGVERTREVIQPLAGTDPNIMPIGYLSRDASTKGVL